jgi:flagellin-like protein
MKRKGVSAIIATILLIVVAVILVGILLSWSQTFVNKTTSNADSTIDTSCNGASVNIISCDYNSVSEEITFDLINSGLIAFKSDYNFSALLIDSDSDLNSESTNILDSNSLGIGESTQVVLVGYTGAAPIRLQIRSNQCNGYYWEKTCN